MLRVGCVAVRPAAARPAAVWAGAGRCCGSTAAASADPAVSSSTQLDADRLALRLRLGEGWRDTVGKASGDVQAAHRLLVEQGRLESNEAQAAAAAALAQLQPALEKARESRRKWDSDQQRLMSQARSDSSSNAPRRKESAAWRGDGWFKGSPDTPMKPGVIGPACWLSLGRPPSLGPAGCYLHGSVGSGKSTLMDLFCLFGLSEGWRVRRQHFHEFSLSTHQALHGLSDRPDASRKHILACFAEAAARDIDVLCLDEFQVTNVADAAILKEALRLLAELNVSVVCTTNRPPEDLYKDGLHRERYIPALVQQLRSSFLVVSVQGADYREALLQAESGGVAVPSGLPAPQGEAEPTQRVFFEGGSKEAALQEALIGESMPELSSAEVKVSWGRSLPVEAAGGGLGCFHFDDLCRAPLAAEDFLCLATRFHTVFVHDIPCLSLEEHNEARRFTNLVDALYEHSVRLLCHSTVALDEVLRSVEALRDANDAAGHDASSMGVFEVMYDDTPNFQLQIKEAGSREKWREIRDRRDAERQTHEAKRLGRMAVPEAAFRDDEMSLAVCARQHSEPLGHGEVQFSSVWSGAAQGSAAPLATAWKVFFSMTKPGQ